MSELDIHSTSTGVAPQANYPGVVYWFRNDLRVHDQPALRMAVDVAQQLGVWLLPVFVHDTGLVAATRWGFTRTSARRLAWRSMALDGLSQALRALGSTLHELQGASASVLTSLVQQLGGPLVVCEELPAPEERRQVQDLTSAGVNVRTVWQSTLMPRGAFPDPASVRSDQFTPFRQALLKQGAQPAGPAPRIHQCPPVPAWQAEQALRRRQALPDPLMHTTELESLHDGWCFDMSLSAFHGSEQAALAHVTQYCQRGLPHHYKATRNGLMGADYSTKWSPWLSTGALSPRQAWAMVAAFADQHGANEGTEWIFFELLWRDYFRWLHVRHGVNLYRAGGLRHLPTPAHDPVAFQRWCQGNTGQPFIDAGMRELAATGYLSNRMRQNVASYLIHDLQCDWRAGAAWFESQLLDFDVFSNQGNWLYLSGAGTDPRGSRRFNPLKQSDEYDPEGRYQQAWAAPD